MFLCAIFAAIALGVIASVVALSPTFGTNPSHFNSPDNITIRASCDRCDSPFNTESNRNNGVRNSLKP
jgi:hypothetical protein